uniref:Ig-like domain-containing protein n=1 Tax=Leptobrachium leishanense TaxID=445787 RepID=A0A8C5PGW0_9ANUR
HSWLQLVLGEVITLGVHILFPPLSQSVSLGDTVRLPCTLNGHSISDRNVRWLQQQSGNKPRFLLSYASDSSKHQGTGVPDRFSGSKDSPQNVGYLTIKGVLLEDDADYYCGSEISIDKQWLIYTKNTEQQ